MGWTEERLRALVDACPHGVQECDREGIITFSNCAHARMHGYAPGELVGRSVLELIARPADREAFIGYMAGLVRDQPAPAPYETLALVKGGGVFDVRVDWDYLRDEEGDVRGFACIVTDMSAQRRAESELLEHEQAEEFRTRTLRELDHRVKNTIAAILGLMHLSAVGVEDVGDFVCSFEARLRAMARVHEALAEDGWEGLDLGEMLRTTLRPFAIDCVTLRGPSTELAPAVIVPLAQVIYELATNAFKYGALGCEGGRVLVTWTCTDGRRVIEWRERGVESPPSSLREGVGMSLVRGLVECELGGCVAHECTPEGVCWRLELAREAS
ncbi:HWE histidine kinase domain-containing protein [Pseudenhygromyxa sp. WMMC2535]|uniref:sensor histidine kinase n=1 Tax=Pseudenhygromyxa sp. WMMC2535 TaxID=2712867 RepID=UPI0031FA3A3E